MLEDLQDGEVRLGGSIRGAFSNNERSMTTPFFICSYRTIITLRHLPMRHQNVFSKIHIICIQQLDFYFRLVYYVVTCFYNLLLLDCFLKFTVLVMGFLHTPASVLN